MTTFKELIISFFEVSRERLRNPVAGTFAISWIAINWRFVSILFFSGQKMEDRILTIENNYLNLTYNLWYPLIATGIYLFILPNVLAIVDALSRYAISFRKVISNKHKLEDVQAKQEIAVEERQLELVKEGSPDVKKLKDKIEQLEKEKNILLEKQTTTSQAETPAEDLNQQDDNNGSDTASTRKKRTSKKKSTKTNEEKPAYLPTSKEHPSMRENVIRNIAKSEKEWILIYGFYASNFGKKEFTRKDIQAAYEETKRKTSGRSNNLTNNINNLVKQGLLRFLNDDEMLLTDGGIELANEILNR